MRRATLIRLDQVDLVDDDHQPLPRLQGVSGNVLVLGQHPCRSIDHEEHRVSPLHRADPSQQAVALEPVAARRLAPDPCSVDEHHRHSVVQQLGVDRIPGRAGRGTHQRALVAQQRIQQRGLADIRAAHDRKPVRATFLWRALGSGRQLARHAVQELADAKAVLSREKAWFGESKLEQLMSEMPLRR